MLTSNSRIVFLGLAYLELCDTRESEQVIYMANERTPVLPLTSIPPDVPESGIDTTRPSIGPPGQAEPTVNSIKYSR